MKWPFLNPISFTVTVRLMPKIARTGRINGLPDYPDIVNLSLFFCEIKMKVHETALLCPT